MDQNQIPDQLSFGDFTVHRRERSLRKHGNRLNLTGQSLDILVLLLERGGDIVTREELQAKLWKANSYVDIENGLNAAVKKLRQTLGDSAETPRYIETLPRVGYRLLVPVTAGVPPPSGVPAGPAVTSSPLAPADSPEPETPGPAAVAAEPRRWRHAAAGALALLIVAGIWFSKSHRAAPLSDTDLVLISDFVNTTGDPVFEDTLKRAVLVELSQSPHFNILNEFNLRETLRLMDHTLGDKLEPPLDLQVCQRAGAKVAVAGSIVALGSQYVLTLDAKNCLTGAIVAHQESRAPGRDQVLSTLGALIAPLRSKLGESLATIEKFNTPILEATTPSLSALKAYTVGDDMRFRDKEEESVSFYRMAVELDPNFAIAYARLGAIYRNLDQLDLSRQHMKKAFDLRSHISEKEKFYIAAHYYTDVTQEVDKAIQTYELWTQTYPNDWIAYNNLADVASRSGLVDKALPAAQQTLRLNPNVWFAYGVLSNAYLRASRFPEAKAICERAAAENHVGATIKNTALRLAYLEHDQAAADKILESAKGKSNESLLLTLASLATSGRGETHAARALAQQAENLSVQRDNAEEASNTAYDESLFEAEVGNAAEARLSVEQAMRWNADPASRGFAALTLARVGEANRAASLVQEADVRPLDTVYNAVVLASARAAIALARNNPKQALQELTAALPYDLSELASGQTFYLRGLAYLQAGSATEAQQQFQKLIDNHGSAVTVYWPLAHLGLARAYAVGGETEKARETYRRFFALWKDADPDLRIVRDAQAQYEKLNASGVPGAT
jgi:DNA-binding winged helix-turn-helix (wHTH) protein/tetratricopeptide (TPR) repeat protein